MKKLFLILLIFPSLLWTCKKAELVEPVYPRLSTQPVVEVSDSTATFAFEIISLGNQKIKNYGFEWMYGNGPSLEPVSESIELLATDLTIGRNVVTVKHGLTQGDLFYFRGFIKTESGFKVTDNGQSFTAKGSSLPVISKVIPREVSSGDTIRISGKYFSNLISKVRVGVGADCRVVKTTDTEIICILPELPFYTKYDVLVTASGRQTITKEAIEQTGKYNIVSVSSLNVLYGQIITVIGKGFRSLNSQYPTIFLNTTEVQLGDITDTSLVFRFPDKFPTATADLTVQYAGAIKKFGQPLKIIPFTVTNISPKQVSPSSGVTITGTGFHLGRGNKVFINNVEVDNVYSNDGQTMTFAIPDIVYNTRQLNVRAEIYGVNETSPSTSVSISPALQLVDNGYVKLPPPSIDLDQREASSCRNFFNGFTTFNDASSGSVAMVYDNTDNRYYIHKYTPSNGTWTKTVINGTIPYRSSYALRVIGNKLFILGGKYCTNTNQDNQVYDPSFYCYDLSTRTLEKLPDFIGQIDNPAYITWYVFPTFRGLLAYKIDGTTYEYVFQSKTWSKKKDFGQLSNNNPFLNGFLLGQTTYAITFDFSYLYKYNSNADTWEYVRTLNEGPDYLTRYIIEVGKEVYIVRGDGITLFNENQAANKFADIKLEKIATNYEGAHFIVGQKLYILSNGIFVSVDLP